jgi:hypothetical protein
MVLPDAGTLSLKNEPQQWFEGKSKRISPIAAVCLNVAMLVVAIVGFAGCGGVEGTYTAGNGALTLVLKGGGDASITFMGQTAPCKYNVNGSTLALTCEGQAGNMNFTIQKDGSLAGPPDSLIPPLQKK